MYSSTIETIVMTYPAVIRIKRARWNYSCRWMFIQVCDWIVIYINILHLYHK